MSIYAAKMDASRRVGALGKRKEPEYYSSPPPSEQQLQRAIPVNPEPRKPAHNMGRFAKPHMPLPPPPQGGNNKLLAGYLAHEFLRFGSLLGERTPAPPGRKEPATALEPERRYAAASTLLMAGGTHIPGVVNPTQLGRWLRIKE